MGYLLNWAESPETPPLTYVLTFNSLVFGRKRYGLKRGERIHSFEVGFHRRSGDQEGRTTDVQRFEGDPAVHGRVSRGVLN